MKKISNPSPIEVLFTIVAKKEVDNVLKILNEFKEKNSIVVFGHGTVESEIVNLFGFGLLERGLTISIIKAENSSVLIERISKDLQFETDEHVGLAFTVPINSIEKEFLNYLLNPKEV